MSSCSNNLNQEKLSVYGKLSKLISNMNSNISFDEALCNIYNTFSDVIPYSYIGVALLNEDRNFFEAVYGVSNESNKNNTKKILETPIFISDTNFGKIIENRKPVVINDIEFYNLNNRDTVLKSISANLNAKAAVIMPLKLRSIISGIILISSCSKNVFEDEHINMLETLSDLISLSFNESIVIDRLEYESAMEFIKMSQIRDEFSGEHIERIKAYSEKIAEILFKDNKYSDTINQKYINDIKRFSPFYDIGKVSIKDGILLKPGKLTYSEFEEIKKHTVYGADILKSIQSIYAKYGRNEFDMAIDIAGGHHEKWDGTGYPCGKMKEEIPLCARIVSIADVFDALTSKRPYKEAFSFDRSFDIILEGSGKNFDPNIIESLLKHKEELYDVYIQFKRSLVN